MRGPNEVENVAVRHMARKTHPPALAELISEKCETKRIDLINHEGKTMDRNDLSESGGKIWNFED